MVNIYLIIGFIKIITSRLFQWHWIIVFYYSVSSYSRQVSIASTDVVDGLQDTVSFNLILTEIHQGIKVAQGIVILKVQNKSFLEVWTPIEPIEYILALVTNK